MITGRNVFIIIIIAFSLSACYYDKGDKLYPYTSACDTIKMNYNSHIKPILKTNCLDKGCHTTSNPSGSIILETYGGVTPAIAGSKLINALKYTSGGSKNMPPTGKLSACEILKVEAWISRGNPEN